MTQDHHNAQGRYNPDYDDIAFRRPNKYRDMLAQYPRIILPPREARERRGAWKDGFAALHLEIGCAEGQFLAAQAPQRPGELFVGVELRFKRVYKAAERAHFAGLANVQVLRYNASLLADVFAPGEVDFLYVFFPDPWPREKHRKHRIVQQEGLDCWHDLLKPGGVVELKTDHAAYFTQMEETAASDGRFLVTAVSRDLAVEPHLAAHLASTRFERLFLGKGCPVHYLQLRRT